MRHNLFSLTRQRAEEAITSYHNKLSLAFQEAGMTQQEQFISQFVAGLYNTNVQMNVIDSNLKTPEQCLEMTELAVVATLTKLELQLIKPNSQALKGLLGMGVQQNLLLKSYIRGSQRQRKGDLTSINS